MGVAEVYENEKKECLELIQAIDWKYGCLESALLEYRCPKCGSGLIDVAASGDDRDTATFTCRSCGEEWSFEELVPLAISEYFTEGNYRSIKDGGDPLTITCPECGEDTYVLDDDVCVLCEESTERECRRCAMTIPPEEINGGGYCSYCAHIMSKDD